MGEAGAIPLLNALPHPPPPTPIEIIEMIEQKSLWTPR